MLNFVSNLSKTRNGTLGTRIHASVSLKTICHSFHSLLILILKNYFQTLT